MRIGVIRRLTLCCVSCVAAVNVMGQQNVEESHWNAPDRAAKVTRLLPGRRIPEFTPDTLFLEWSREQVQRWEKEHGSMALDEAYVEHAAAAPTDAELVRDFPRHISPFGRLRDQQNSESTHRLTSKVDKVLTSYCPMCASFSMGLDFDPDDPYGHATTTCCRTHLYADAADWPADAELKPTVSVRFLHLDEEWVDVPCTRYTDADGVEWELFISTIFAHKRWQEQGCELVRQYMTSFRETADPRYVHKIAIILDQVADTYYGLPLSSHHRLCSGRNGGPLTRKEWEAVPRPAIFEVSYLGPWSRRKPYGSTGWLNMMDEHIWVEPFARTRHHPAFKEVSRQLYGDSEALDRKIMGKLMRELSLMFQSVFAQKLLHNYQEAIYIDLWLLGVLLQDDVLIDFAAPCQELTMYNHTYQDGMNGEGAPNYQAMPGGYYFPVLRDPDGWLQYQPGFLEQNPFYWAASSEMYKSRTVRGLSLEWGDQHEHVFSPSFITASEKVKEKEKVGSRNWPGYGVGVLRVGGPGHRQEVSLGYTRASLHNAQDALSMECWFDGVPVMRRGGYAAHWCNAPLQWERQEYQALRQMDYPHDIEEAATGWDAWSWVWAHSPQNQNALTIDEVATGKGWGDNRGYGECLTYKGGEEAGSPGSGFQVLEVLDHYSWARVEKEVSDWRRVLIGVEGPDGRPYALDIMHVTGGRRHALYNQAWAQRADAELPEVSAEAADLSEIFFGESLPEDTAHYRNFRQVRKVTRHRPKADTYGVTWRQDYGSWGPRDPDGKPYRRPVPADVGDVRLRFIGLNDDDEATELLSGKGPWVGWLRQPLPNGQRVNGNVSFTDARDFLIEYRTGGTGDAPLSSSFVHILEGYRAGERSVIEEVSRVPVRRLGGLARQILAVKMRFTAGHSDVVLYQTEPGMVEIDGIRTDARFALIRRTEDGEVMTAHAVRVTTLEATDLSVSMPGDFAGTIVDVIGDLTGTRRESALIIRPEGKGWPLGQGLQGRQLNIRIESELRADCDEGYRIAGIRQLPNGLIRVDLQDYAPFAVSWHEVTELPEDRPNVIRTWRPMVDHGNSPWYHGLSVWFPERGQTYTIHHVNEVKGGYGGDILQLVEDVNLREEGIRRGDWYVIYGIRPGLRVHVANDLTWRKEPAAEWTQYGLRATGAVTVDAPILRSDASRQTGENQWQAIPIGGPLVLTHGDEGVTHIVADKPSWLKMEDAAGPELVTLKLDGVSIDRDQTVDLGWIEPPKEVQISFEDAVNPISRGSLQILLDGKAVPSGNLLEKQFSKDGRQVTLAIDLAGATAQEKLQPRRHRLEVTVTDQSIERHRSTVALSYLKKVPLDPDAVYLSDLRPVKAIAHGGPNIDRDYVGELATIGDRAYPKCIMVCPKRQAGGAFGEVVFELPADAPRVLHADIGIEDHTGANGSAVFAVQSAASASGPWTILYTSPVMRGGTDAVKIHVDLKNAQFLRLYTTDGGDNINSDHALWGNARLLPR